ncbi:hypothetical protein V7S43_010451 [Phytophthora oleae]|uniref:Fibronectin type III-like domain-containing protein n=1 Tax=Phytophthora oleae TaxID=2107226 RepID=A0ABD3FFM1_9STRA
MLFLTQPYRSISVPEVKQLKKFSKISLEVGESQTVAFTLTSADWSVYYPQIGQGLKLVAEDADYVIAIKPETDCDVYNNCGSESAVCDAHVGDGRVSVRVVGGGVRKINN